MSTDLHICASLKYVPRLGVILGKLELMLGYDVGVLIEDNEPDRSGCTSARWRNMFYKLTHVVPQSKDPTNSPCFNVMADSAISLELGFAAVFVVE